MSIQKFYLNNIDLTSCIDGDRKSQQALYNFYAPKMLAIAFRYAKNSMDAEDILQEGFVKLFNNLSRFRGEGSFDGWVRRIFVNTAIEHVRKNKIVSSDICDKVENAFADVRKSGLDNLMEKDLLQTTETLSDGYKTVFNLYAVEGYTHKEIADKLGITESTSKSQFSRAKAILRSLLQDTRMKNELGVMPV